QKTKNCAAVVGIGRMIDETGREMWRLDRERLDHEDLLNWWFGNDFLQPACFFTRKAFEACGALNEQLYFAFDLELWLKMSKLFKFERSPNVFANALCHPAAKTVAFRQRLAEEVSDLFAGMGHKGMAKKIRAAASEEALKK
ncbi:MAG: hypothetical protein AABZ57_03770, partial [Candidatus Margulisiibacteriota bacterium]